MPVRSAKADEILDAAERLARTGGYNGFSFREIAKQVGIKAASVHYHFPGKDDLGVALARRYTERFLGGLGDPEDPSIAPNELLRRYVDAYRRSLVDEGLMCLCGMFGAEVAYLPPPVAAEAKLFFDRNIDWLVRVFARATSKRSPDESRAAAIRIIAVLEGAMLMARSLDDTSVFEAAAAGISPSV